MKVNYSGWTQKTGFFHHDIFVDENRTDYAVHFANGDVARQNGKFETRTEDWNHDGDVYSMFGAFFQYIHSDGSISYGDFFTPEDLVRFAVDALDPDASGPKVAYVEGIEIPKEPRQPSLNDRILQSEARAMHQECERNRKMASLGIRHPGEPWAR